MAQDPKLGNLYASAGNGVPGAVALLSNETNVNYLIKVHKGSGYLAHFTDRAKEAKAALVKDLREANVSVAEDDEAHLLNVCGVRCRDPEHCAHVLSGDRLPTSVWGPNTTASRPPEQREGPRMIVACDPIQTKLRDDAVECFPRLVKGTDREELVVRVHLYYPNDMPCGSIHDKRARLVTQKHFVPLNARSSQGCHVFHYVNRGARSAPVSDAEAMFPFTTKAGTEDGFSTERKCTAVTVETVFVRDASRQQPPYYTEDTEQTRVFLSYLRATKHVTDDELSARYPGGVLEKAAMPAFAEDRDEEKFNVLARLYLLARDQGWASMLTARAPHPNGNPNLPALFRTPSTELDVADRSQRHAPVLLRQDLRPDMESQITRFCFRGIVSEALRRGLVARSTDDPSYRASVVCYMPYGDRVPAFTDTQIAVLATLYPTLDIRRPTSAADWRALSQTLHRCGVSLLSILEAVGEPLRDQHGAAITTDAYVPYTADMAHAFFLVIVNRPLRDYTCTVNQRWLVEELMDRSCDSGTTRDAFGAWVRYWNAMVQLKHEQEDQLETDIISSHLGQRLPAGAKGQWASCLVNGRVADSSGGVVFAGLGGRRFTDAAHVGNLPPGTSVVYLFRWDGQKLRFEYVQRMQKFVGGLRTLQVTNGVATIGRAAQGRNGQS